MMSDRKTAAELREMARRHGGDWLYAHLAAVEEEREAPGIGRRKATK